MGVLVDVTIPVEADAALALQSPERRQAAGHYLSVLLRDGGIAELLSATIADMKRQAAATGLTDEEVDAELEAWRNERSA